MIFLLKKIMFLYVKMSATISDLINQLEALKNKYNNDIRTITNNYNSILSALYKSKAPNKIVRIQNTHNLFKNDIQSLTNNYNNKVSVINSKIATINANNKPNTSTIISGTTSVNNTKKALLIGINYVGTPYRLNGCINDVNKIQSKINSYGFSNQNIKKLTDNTASKPTRANILLEFKNLLVNSTSGDTLFFLYSGHGTQVLDRNNEETDGKDECIVSLDLQTITDDEIKTLIQTYLKNDVSLFALFDSCYSGSVLDLRYQYLDSLNYDNDTQNMKEQETIGNVIMISGCTDKQTSADAYINNAYNGAMSWSFITSLQSNSKPTWRDLIKNMRSLLKSSKFTQIPQLSTGKSYNIDTSIFL